MLTSKNDFNLTLYTQTADRCIYIASPYRAVNTFHLGYENQSVYAVSGTSRCLFSDKYKTYKYSVCRPYSCSMMLGYIFLYTQFINA